MSSRADEIRRRIEKRKRERERMQKNVERRILWNDEEESNDHNTFHFENDNKDDFHPLFRKDLFLLKILGAAVLFLAVAIIVRNQSPTLQKAETSIRQAMDQEFNFAFVSDWYEDQFGKPLAFLPTKAGEEEPADDSPLQQYALSASGKILEDFADTGQRVAIETGIDTTVQALNEGTVTFIGEKEGFGNTVVIQHSDKSESWYGNLEEVDVRIYEAVKKGTKVGLASGYGTNETLGLFYFAIKKDDDFIDPIQVIEFE